MRYAKFLNKGGTIGFVAPSFGCATEPYKALFENAQKKFTERGYGIEPGPNCYAARGIGISNTPEKCGLELTKFYCSDTNNALISCGGGELMCTILDYVDFDSIRKADPKWFMGYSDNTNFTYLLTTLCDVASIYGPCAASFGMEPWHEAIEDAMLLLEGEKLEMEGYSMWERDSAKTEESPLVGYNVTEPRILTASVESAEFGGRLIGGCVDCLTNLLGTSFDKTAEFCERYREDGIIWFLESCDLNPMSINRAMWHMEHAGWFKHVKGFLVGRPVCHGEELLGLNHIDAALSVLGRYNVPVIMDADIGHLNPAMPLICGSMAEVSLNGQNLRVSMKLE